VYVVLEAEGIPAVKETDCLMIDLTASTKDSRASYGGRSPFGYLGVRILNRDDLDRYRAEIHEKILVDLVA